MKLENISRRDFLIRTSIILLPLVQCSKSGEDNVTGPSDSSSGNSLSFKYLAFRVTKGNPPSDAENFRVGIYNQSNKQREVYGSCGLHGNFYTVTKIDSSKEHRIEIYKPSPSSGCITAFWDFSYSSAPELWRGSMSGFDPKRDSLPLGVHLGTNWEKDLVDDAWGS